ncbi:hypothetical protein [Lysobacter sp. A3-1-A15]|uniref:hypothetical protein n=1 Tax=Novilysobacter viscosus TaxID=3098602 RepID=UPI002EDA00C4
MLARSLPYLLATALVALAGCQRGSDGAFADPARTLANAGESGALVNRAPRPEAVVPPAERTEREIDWRPMDLTDGRAWIGCDPDYAAEGDGEPLANLGFTAIWHGVADCRDEGRMRLRYRGKINAEFTALMERVSEIATIQGVHGRILDIDSAGGMIEDGIRAGDRMAEADWTIWVREGAVCHSACVLVLAGGDMRLIAGDIGIHRMMRIDSEATSRAELNRELREVHALTEAYLERNGAAVTVADLMMTVPNRSLRLLTGDELYLFGLTGPNAVEDDLDRIRLGRKCGESFVQRRDRFFRAFDNECTALAGEVDQINACGLALRRRFGFPDAACPSDSPLSEYN